jgi:hypothetical protein
MVTLLFGSWNVQAEGIMFVVAAPDFASERTQNRSARQLRFSTSQEVGNINLDAWQHDRCSNYLSHAYRNVKMPLLSSNLLIILNLIFLRFTVY